MTDQREKLDALIKHLRAHREELAIALAKDYEDMSPEEVCGPLAEVQGAIQAVGAVIADLPGGYVERRLTVT